MKPGVDALVCAAGLAIHYPVPVIILQRHIVAGLTLGAVKG